MTRPFKIFVFAALVALAVSVFVVSCADIELGPGGDSSDHDNDDGVGPDSDDDADDDDGDAGGAGPLFYEDVSPIFANRCLACHQPGGVAPFSLARYEDAVPYAVLIRDVVGARAMPPWLLDDSGDCGEYADSAWLSEAEIATIVGWIDSGLGEGDPAKAASVPEPPKGLEDPDLIFDPGFDYEPDLENGDEYRCFVFDTNYDTPKFIEGFEFRSTSPKQVHHIVMHLVYSPDAEQRVRNLDAEDPKPGFECYLKLPEEGTAIAALTGPASGVNYYPPDTGVRIPAGRPIVMQIHYHENGPVEPDRSTARLALADEVGLEGSVNTAGIAGVIQDFHLPAGEPSVEHSHERTLETDYDVVLWGLLPHMHELGVSYQLEQIRGGDKACVARTHHWDFNWQHFGWFERPVVLTKGDILRTTCTYDTTSRDEDVYWGMSTEDEMCISYMFVTFADSDAFPSK
ncbi:hypothetical protein K8I61_04110 [bacterium]|nr:hypothetical protein [bacterium]